MGKVQKVIVIMIIILSIIKAQDSTNIISQFGITWTFDKEYRYGQFVNGDYWVIGPVNIINIAPASTLIEGRTMNGSMVNPLPSNGITQGFDSETYGIYGPDFNAEMNAARPGNNDLSSANPLILSTNSSLISTISDTLAGNRPQIKTASILTVINEVPQSGSFRPWYCGNDKSIRFSSEDINISLLKNLETVENTPLLSDVEKYFERPWIDFVPGWLGRHIHPSENMPDYGAFMASRIGDAALMFHLDFSAEGKLKLLYRYIQLGLDLYGIAINGGENNWTPNGGHASGRKWPIIFSGLILGNSEMINIGPGDRTGNVEFGEDGQTFYVTQTDINMVHSPDPRAEAMQYEQSDLGLPEWGIVHSTEPVRDNKNWDATYRICCTGSHWPGFVLAAHIMGVKEIWNHDALFDYMDRYMELTKSEDPANDIFSVQMWTKYRADYGNVWTNIFEVINNPAEFGISQNYPNPFNPTTTIEFTLPKDSDVMLKVYNILGQEVSTLVNKQMKAGYHKVKFDASSASGGLSSGIYLYKIQSGDFSAVKKLMLVK